MPRKQLKQSTSLPAFESPPSTAPPTEAAPIQAQGDAALEHARLFGHRFADIAISSPHRVDAYHTPPVIQPALVKYRKQDNQLNTFLGSLDGLVGNAATWALNVDNVPDGKSGYYDRWKDLGQLYLADVTGKKDPFLHAAYGYAVETRVNDQIGAIEGDLPAAWSVELQVHAGMTRPDIVVLDDKDAQMAWIDITSDQSIGHIKNKAGGGWNHKPYVYEVTYDQLDPTDISQESTIGQRVKLRNAVKRHKKARKEAESSLSYALIGMIVKYGLTEGDPAKAKAAFEDRFPDEKFSHNKIRSIIEMGDNDLGDFGYGRRQRAGRNKAAAEAFLARQFF